MAIIGFIPGGVEWVWILVILVLLFGARKLPELARSMGSSVTQFKKGLKDDDPPLASGDAAPPAAGEGAAAEARETTTP